MRDKKTGDGIEKDAAAECEHTIHSPVDAAGGCVSCGADLKGIAPGPGDDVNVVDPGLYHLATQEHKVEIDRLTADLAEARKMTAPRAILCVYCGLHINFKPDDRKKVFEEMKEHDLVCDKNPLIRRIWQLEADLAVLSEECTCEECEKSLVDPETGVTAFCMACWNAMITKLQAENVDIKKKYSEAVAELAELQLEYNDLDDENATLKEDVLFLSNRVEQAGRCVFSGYRETGQSSNSIVSIAYNLLNLQSQVLPSDESDLQACKNMWKKLPEFRKTTKVRKAMERAEQALKGESCES